jgi:hypothetical protein
MPIKLVDTVPSGTKLTSIHDPATDEHIQVVSLAAGGVANQVSMIDNGEVAFETIAPLGIGAIYTSPIIDTLNYAGITLSLEANVASATAGLKFRFSNDGLVWSTTDEYTYNPSSLKTYALNVVGRYLQVTYTNGTVGQTTFRLWVLLKKIAGIPSSHRIGDTLVQEDDAQLVQAVLKARRPDGTFYNIDASQNGNLFVGIGDIQADAGGRVRVSQFTTLGDYKIIGYDRTNYLWENAGTGTGAYANNKFNMSVTAGQWYVKQSRRFVHYFSGKSQVVEMTFDGFSPQAGVVKRCGYFSSSAVSPFSATLDGFWVESDGSTIRLIASRAGTETLNVPITSWTGYGFLNEYQTLATWNNFTVVLIDFLWLGGAVLRLWIKTARGFILAHVFNYSGTSPDVFILSPNKPLRYEIRSTVGVGSFRYICAQIATEGSTVENGFSRSVDVGTATIPANVIGTTYPIKAIRKQAIYRDISVKIEEFTLLVATSDTVLWSIQINPTLSAPLTYAAVANSAVEAANGNGTITVTAAGGILASGYLVQSVLPPMGLLRENFLAYLGGSLSNVMDQYVLCVTPISVNTGILATIGYKEF